MSCRSLLVVLVFGSLVLPLACGGQSEVTTNESGSGGSGNAVHAGKGGSAGSAGSRVGSALGGAAGFVGNMPSGGHAGIRVPGSGGARLGAGGAAAGRDFGGVPSGGFGFGGPGGVPPFGAGGRGIGGRQTVNAGTSGGGVGESAGNSTIGESAGQGGSDDAGASERLPLCRSVCAFAPADTGTGGDTIAVAGAAGANDVPGAGGAPASGPSCGNTAACIAAICPEQRSAHCGDLLTAYIECLAGSSPALVTSCTVATGPDLSALILDSCYGRYADWTRGCL
jgi:hypothetical protein